MIAGGANEPFKETQTQGMGDVELVEQGRQSPRGGGGDSG